MQNMVFAVFKRLPSEKYKVFRFNPEIDADYLGKL